VTKNDPRNADIDGHAPAHEQDSAALELERLSEVDMAAANGALA
jgi:hypothetical protein